MKRPWMPFYVADYLQDTAHLSPTEHGAYLLLILHYWTKGGLPSDEESIRRITRLNPRQWSHSCDLLRSLFLTGWRHKRIDSELAKAIEKSKVNSANAKRSRSDRTATAKPTPTQSQSQSEEYLFSEKTDSLPEEGVKPKAAKPQRPKPVSDWPPDYREQWWAVYPRKTEKKAALAKLDAIHKGGNVSWSRFMAGTNRYAMHIASNGTEERFVKHPTTWLNRGCWEDEYKIQNGGKTHEADRGIHSIKTVHGLRGEILRRQARAAAAEAAGGGEPTYGHPDSAGRVVELETGEWSQAGQA